MRDDETGCPAGTARPLFGPRGTLTLPVLEEIVEIRTHGQVADVALGAHAPRGEHDRPRSVSPLRPQVRGDPRGQLGELSDLATRPDAGPRGSARVVPDVVPDSGLRVRVPTGVPVHMPAWNGTPDLPPLRSSERN
jgi:hypothetical protein